MYEGSTQLKFRANFVDAERNVPTRLRLVKATVAIVKPTMSIRLGYASPTLYCLMCSHFIPQYVRRKTVPYPGSLRCRYSVNQCEDNLFDGEVQLVTCCY